MMDDITESERFWKYLQLKERLTKLLNPKWPQIFAWLFQFSSQIPQGLGILDHFKSTTNVEDRQKLCVIIQV